MNTLSKRILFTLFLAFFFSVVDLYSQSENEKIETLIEQKRDFNKKNKNSTIFKIQLYNGNESQAYKIKRDFESKFPEYKTKIIYKSPEWKTQVGNFKTRLEADRVLGIIMRKFGQAIVLKDKI